MKITVAIPSRNRPKLLAQCIGSLHARASGKHEVTYVVGCDDDDPNTGALVDLIKAQGVPVKADCRPRAASLGGMVNVISRAYPAEIYCSLCDDVMAVSFNWDDKIHDAWRKRRDGVWWWSTQGGSFYAIVSEKWRAAAGRIFTDYFPFWWDDVWLLQVGRYVTGKPHQHLDIWLEDRAPETQRMRDLEFWTEFYWSRDGERRADAARIHQKLGRPSFKLKLDDEMYRNPDYTGRLETIQSKQGERSPPTPEYLGAKARAEALMGDAKVLSGYLPPKARGNVMAGHGKAT